MDDTINDGCDVYKGYPLFRQHYSERFSFIINNKNLKTNEKVLLGWIKPGTQSEVCKEANSFSSY